MSDIDDPAEAIHRHAPLPELPDEDVDSEAVRRDVARDDEVLRALAAVLLPEPPQVTRIDVDVENGVDTRVERRLRDGMPPVRPRPVDHDPFSEGILLAPHPDDDLRERLLELGELVQDPDRIPDPRVLRELRLQRLVHHAAADLVARIVDRHQGHPEEPRLARELVVIPRVGGGFVLVQEGFDRGLCGLPRDACVLQEDAVPPEDVREVHLGSPARGMMVDEEVVSELLREKEVPDVRVDAEQRPLHVRGGDVDAGVRGYLALAREPEGEGHDRLRVHPPAERPSPYKAGGHRPHLGSPVQKAKVFAIRATNRECGIISRHRRASCAPRRRTRSPSSGASSRSSRWSSHISSSTRSSSVLQDPASESRRARSLPRSRPRTRTGPRGTSPFIEARSSSSISWGHAVRRAKSRCPPGDSRDSSRNMDLAGSRSSPWMLGSPSPP